MPYSDAFNAAIGFVLPHENEYARGHWGDPNYVITENVTGDSGGLTKYGIDQASHPGVDIANLTLDSATLIYWQLWMSHNLDALPEAIAIASFDVWVNGGHAVLWLQHAVNETGFTPALIEDGSMGPMTLAAAQNCNQQQVVQNFILERNARFEAIAANNPQDQKFLAGWEQRDIDLANYLKNMTA